MTIITAAETTSIADEVPVDRTAAVQELYARYSAPLAAHVAELLAKAGRLEEVDDVTQELRLCTMQLLVMPTPDVFETWLTLARLAKRAIAGCREVEVPVGLRPTGEPVRPLLDRYDEEHVGRAMGVRREKVRRARESARLGFSAYHAA